MYRVEVFDKNRGSWSLKDVFLYEKLENAIYESTHGLYGLFDRLDEKKIHMINPSCCHSVILNDEFIFSWGNSVEVRIKKATARDSAPEGVLLYGDKQKGE